MQIMGTAIIQTISDLLPPDQYTQDVKCAWESLYEYICKLFHDSIAHARNNEDRAKVIISPSN